MRTRSAPSFDHGAALRVPPAHDVRSWRMLLAWLGDAGRQLDGAGSLEVSTPAGVAVAGPGDWIVLSISGRYHVAHGRGQHWDA